MSLRRAELALCCAALAVPAMAAALRPLVFSASALRLRVSAPAAAGAGAQALLEPPVIASRHGVLNATLVASEARVSVAGQRVLAKVYNGSYAAPTLVVHPGDEINVKLVNRLREPTNLHFHGLTVSPGGHADNVFVSVPAGRSFQYSFRLPRDAASGTYWYHSHEMAPAAPGGAMGSGARAAANGPGAAAGPTSAGAPAAMAPGMAMTPGMMMSSSMTMLTEEQVSSGLSGAIEVQGLRRHLPPGLAHVRERMLTLKDAEIANGVILAQGVDGNAATTRMLDGQVDPRIDIGPGETQLWHLANIGANVFYDVSLAGQAFTVIAQDGHPAIRAWRAADLVLAPGMRFDVLVRGPRSGTAQLRTLAYDQGFVQYPEQTLARLRSAGGAVRAQRLPLFIDRHQLDLRTRTPARRRQIVLSEARALNLFFIDGRQYDPRRIDVHARLNTVEEWTLVNSTTERHPFHLHTYPMQVVAIDGRRVPFDHYQDEVILPPLGKVVVRIRFAQFAGLTVFHCHILAHEDRGMMANILVTK
ncbi:MAG TPA: multicopper oxidase family protein [Solirubrobacteraceae bacterium]